MRHLNLKEKDKSMRNKVAKSLRKSAAKMLEALSGSVDKMYYDDNGTLRHHKQSPRAWHRSFKKSWNAMPRPMRKEKQIIY